ncbi:MAG TPA: AI-2E family transporter [Rhizobiaceae bacterium]|nr:AI-2E family transporter [Rhizobiaceae bacterium]
MREALERSIRRQALFWAVAIILFCLVLYILGNTLMPFIAGMALAYFLDPVADFLERRGLSRLLAASVILIALVLFFVFALLLVVPILVRQSADLASYIPQWLDQLQARVRSWDFSFFERFWGQEKSVLQNNAGEIVKQGAGWIGTVVSGIWQSGQAFFSIASLLVITPVVAFYLLYDWDNMVARLDDLLPRDHRDTIRRLMSEIDAAVAGFVRGQGTLCLVLGLFYATALTIAGLNFGLVIGLVAGAISFIPFVGSIVGFLLSVGVALVQFWPDWTPIAIVAGIFFFGQFLEGNILQPYLVGSQVRLHPVWVMFALIVFGALFGFTGLLVAVPTAAAIGVIVRFATERYLESELYHGHSAIAARHAAAQDETPPRGSTPAARSRRKSGERPS